MLNRELAGKEYPAIPFEVEAERIRAFAAAVGDDNPAYGGERPVAPPTFAMTVQIEALRQIAGDPELGLDFSRVLHGEQDFEWDRQLAAGDRLTARPRILEIRGREPLEFLIIESTIEDEAGMRVVIARTTLIVRGEGA